MNNLITYPTVAMTPPPILEGVISAGFSCIYYHLLPLKHDGGDTKGTRHYTPCVTFCSTAELLMGPKGLTGIKGIHQHYTEVGRTGHAANTGGCSLYFIDCD